MSTNVLKLPGDYNIITNPGGTITLSVGGTSTNGTVVIDGNLDVKGVQTVIESINSVITDNILTLNNGESNNNSIGQVSLGQSGLKIDRGFSGDDNHAAFFVYDDTVDYLKPGGGSAHGVWSFGPNIDSTTTAFGAVIRVAGVTVPKYLNTLTFFGTATTGGFVLAVKTTGTYKDYVTDPDHIPNKDYVDSLLGATDVANKLQVGNSAITVYDSDVSFASPYYSATDKVVVTLGTSTNSSLIIEDTKAQFKGLTLAGTRLQTTNTSSNVNIYIEPSGSGFVQMDSGVRIQQTPAIASTAGYTAIYSTSTVGGGGTGLYYVNQASSDELVSRRRSIIYGIIF